MKDRRALIVNIIFFGSLWGLLEASLGYALHFLPQLISGSVMFPIGAVIMYWAYRNTGTKRTILFMGLLAITIKALNFFMPGLPPIKTYNPMISIMLQTLLVTGLVYAYDSKYVWLKPLSLLFAAIGWRALFIANIAINYALTGYVFSQLASGATIFSFIIVSGLIEAGFLMVVYLLSLLGRKRVSFLFKPNWLLASITLAAAVSLIVVNMVV